MSKLSEALFSKAAEAVLDTVFQRHDGIHLRALMSYTGLSSASAQRELAKLAEAGILLKEEIGRVIVYKANPQCPIYFEIKAIIQKTSGVANMLKEALLPFQHQIGCAFIYGSVAKGEDTAASDIDLMVVAHDLGSADLYPMLITFEETVGRKVSLTVYRPAEFQKKIESGNHFLTSVLAGPKIPLTGELDEH